MIRHTSKNGIYASSTLCFILFSSHHLHTHSSQSSTLQITHMHAHTPSVYLPSWQAQSVFFVVVGVILKQPVALPPACCQQLVHGLLQGQICQRCPPTAVRFLPPGLVRPPPPSVFCSQGCHRDWLVCSWAIWSWCSLVKEEIWLHHWSQGAELQYVSVAWKTLNKKLQEALDVRWPV